MTQNILQIDLFEKKAKNWYDEGAVPSEPFFVPRPGATEEDDGNYFINTSIYNKPKPNVVQHIFLDPTAL